MAKHYGEMIVAALPAPGDGIAELMSPVDGTLEVVAVFLRGAPSATGDAVFDVHKSGQTVWADQTQRLRLLAGQSTGTRALAATVQRGEWVRIDADVVPAGGFGAPLGFLLTFRDTQTGERATAQVQTAQLQPGAEATGTVALAKTFAALKVETSAPARFRLYSSAAYRAADASRAIGALPEGSLNEHGLLVEVVATAGNLALDLAPAVLGWSAENSTNLPFALTNMSNLNQAVTATITFIALEA